MVWSPVVFSAVVCNSFTWLDFMHALLKLELCFQIGILELCLSIPKVFMHPGTVFAMYTVAKKVTCYQLELGNNSPTFQLNAPVIIRAKGAFSPSIDKLYFLSSN